MATVLDVEAAMSEWRPIKTAPKDGTYVWLWCPSPYYPEGGRIEKGSFRRDEGFSGNKKRLWLNDKYDEYSLGYASTPLDPTHWMPLPKPPSADTKITP